MSLLTLPDARSASASQRPAAVRVYASNGSQRVVPLALGKTTIGSSPQCIVCLPPGEARPLQCLVTATAEHAEATRWGAGALLNGRDFTRSAVHAGDRLSIGHFQIEFLAAETLDPAAQAKESPVVATPMADHSSDSTPVVASQSDDPLPPEAGASQPEVVHRESQAEQAMPTVATVAQQAAELPPLVAVVAPDATPPVEIAAIVETPFAAATSQSFGDRLIVDLWQAAYYARRRASALIRGVRDARILAAAMAADLSAMEVELDLARAAYDSHAHDHEQLHLELLERDRQATERMAPLQAEIDSLRSQLQESQTELSEQAAHCEELDAALAIAAQPVPATDAPPSVDAERVKELEQSLAVQIDQASWLARELGGLRSEIERARNELEHEATRSRDLEAELKAAQAASATLEHSKLELDDRDQTIALLKSELASRDAEVSDLSSQLADAEEKRLPPVEDVWASQAAPAALIEAPAESQAVESIPSESTGWPAIEADKSPAWSTPQPAPQECDAAPEAVKRATPELSELLAPVESTPAPVAASETASTSFIDKYRHLLDESGEAAPTEQPSKMNLDEEFLSPAKAAQHVSPTDDSDDALEAYMAGMMQRVRGSSNGPAHLAPVVEAPASVAATSPKLPASASAPGDDEALDAEPFDIESMKLGRRPGASTDLTAMREIANSSARSAIATHRKRRTAESTVGKVVVAVIALATAGCLMWTATSARDWEFIVGAGFGVIGLAVAAMIARGAVSSTPKQDAAQRTHSQLSDESPEA